MVSRASTVADWDSLTTEADLQSAFAALAAEHPAPPLRAEYAAQLRDRMRTELSAQAARRAQPWWLAWRRWVAAPAQPVRRAAVRPVQPRYAPGLRFALAGVAVVMVLALAGALVAQLYPLGTSAQAATVSVKSGAVQVSRPVRVIVDVGLTRRFTVSPAEIARLKPGDELSSNVAAEAEIALPDGSRIAMGPDVALSIEELQARTSSKPLVVAMRLERGEVRSQVEHLRADRDRFEVSTPNLVAQVRGTVFRIDVRSDGTRVATEKGLVRVNWNGQALDVAAGRELQVRLGASVPEVNVRPQSPQMSFDLPTATTVKDPDTDEAYVYTNQASIPWRIQTLPGVQVAFTVNGEEAQHVNADENGLATVVFSPQAEGTYRISAIMETAIGERSLPSPEQIVVVDRTPPALLLNSPADPQVQTGSVVVAGSTDPGVRLELNGKSVPVDQAGEFEQTLSLTPGANQLILVAVDLAGNSIKLQSVIIYETPAG